MEEDDDDRARLDLLLERRDVGEIVDVEEDPHAGQGLLEQLLDRARLVLPRRPHVRDEEVVAQLDIEQWRADRAARAAQLERRLRLGQQEGLDEHL